MFKQMWRGWLKFAHVLGTVQMMIVLTLVYWTILAVMAVPYRFFADSLSTKSRGGKGWTEREPVADRWTEMQSQG